MSEEKTTQSFGPYFLLEPPVRFLGYAAERLLVHRRGGPAVTLYRTLPSRYWSTIRFAAQHFPDTTQQPAPHQLSVTEVGSALGIPYFAEERVAGVWLEELIARRQALPPTLAARLLIEICDALEALYKDLSWDVLKTWELHPRHVRVARSGEVKLSLSGIFHALWSMEPRGSVSSIEIVLVDLKYLSVEQIRGGLSREESAQEKERTGIFALGVVLCELLGGEPFGDGQSIHTTINMLSNAPEVPPETPERLREIIERALQKSERDRYQSFAALAEELRHYLGSSAIGRADVGVLSMAIGAEDDHQHLVEQEAERLRRIKWLSPDAEMEALTAEAIDWLEMRVDEHLALLSPYAGGRELPSRGLLLSRSCQEARRCLQDAEHHTLPEEIFSYIKAQYAARQRTEALCALSLEASNAAEKAIAAGLAAFISGPLGAESRRALGGLLDYQTCRVIVEAHMRHTSIFGGLQPSPWEPLVQLWERGVWPLEMLSGGLLVYVPLYRGESLIAEPVQQRQELGGEGHREAAARLG